MNKLIALCAVALSTAAFADSYLYWMLDESSELDWGTETVPSFDTVKIGVMDNASGANVSYLNLYSTLGGSSIGQSVGLSTLEGGGTDAAVFFANLGSYTGSGYSYYIELLNDSGIVGRSAEFASYSGNTAAILAEISQTAALSGDAWTPSSFTTAAIPEPTSGMLLLFGLAGLALKRKQQKK